MRKTIYILLAATLGLSGCTMGTDIERAAVGAFGGCLVGDAFQEGNCIKGAIVGAGAGALSDDFSQF